MQLVERGKLSLDAPAADVVPELATKGVLDGFDASGKAITRKPKRPITLRHLLTHTSGLGYDTWNADVMKYRQVDRDSGVGSCRKRRSPRRCCRAGRALGVRHLDRLGRQDGRGGERPAARPLHDREHLHAARHGRHRLRASGRRSGCARRQCTDARTDSGFLTPDARTRRGDRARDSPMPEFRSAARIVLRRSATISSSRRRC